MKSVLYIDEYRTKHKISVLRLTRKVALQERYELLNRLKEIRQEVEVMEKEIRHLNENLFRSMMEEEED